MNIDIRLSLEFFDHPKTKKLRKRLGIEGVMALLKLWTWTAGNRPGGILTGLDAEAVELAADWDGEEGAFVAELLALRLLDEDDSVFSIHDWEEHQAYASKSEERSNKARKAAEARWSKAQEMPEKSASNAHSMLGNATSIQEHDVSNAPETRSQKPVFNISTPDGVVVDAEAADASHPGEKRQTHASPACPYDAIVGLYHEAFPEHPRVAIVNAKRKGAMKARWTEAGERLRMLNRDTSAAERLDYFRRLFARASRSDFLTGKKAFRDGTVYRVDFDKLMSPSGFMGVIEGKYDNREVA